MQSQLPFYPEQASNFAPSVDALMTFLILVSVCFSVLISAAIVFFFFKFHRKSKNEIGVPIHGDLRLETTWIVAPAFLALAMFGWVRLSTSIIATRPRTHWTSTSSASSGCGKFSSPTAAER